MNEAAQQRRKFWNHLRKLPPASTKSTPHIDVSALRKRLHLTQAEFAGRFGFPVATLRHWERGNRRLTGTALVLLHVIEDNPRAVLRAVLKARLVFPDFIPKRPLRRSFRAPPGSSSPVW